MTVRQREILHRDRKHLAFVRSQPCCVTFCGKPAEAAHIRYSQNDIGKHSPGMQRKPDDKYTVPLCPYHHRIGIDCQHNGNEKLWWEIKGIDPFAVAAALWIESGGAARALLPQPVKRPKKTKARKPSGQRVKIHSANRTIPGRRFDGSPIPSHAHTR